jgi:hypothetical protein
LDRFVNKQQPRPKLFGSGHIFCRFSFLFLAFFRICIDFPKLFCYNQIALRYIQKQFRSVLCFEACTGLCFYRFDRQLFVVRISANFTDAGTSENLKRKLIYETNQTQDVLLPGCSSCALIIPRFL